MPDWLTWIKTLLPYMDKREFPRLYSYVGSSRGGVPKVVGPATLAEIDCLVRGVLNCEDYTNDQYIAVKRLDRHFGSSERLGPLGGTDVLFPP